MSKDEAPEEATIQWWAAGRPRANGSLYAGVWYDDRDDVPLTAKDTLLTSWSTPWREVPR